MNVYNLEEWCRQGNGGVIGRTLLLPLSSPRVWEPTPLPTELASLKAIPGQPVETARLVKSRLGLAIAVGFALLLERPEEPIAHAFNVTSEAAIDLALDAGDVVGYWGYIPTDDQLEVDRNVLSYEAPRPDGRVPPPLWPRRQEAPEEGG